MKKVCADSNGLFWSESKGPPPRTWERPDYLPYYDEARAFNVPAFQSLAELDQAAAAGDVMLFDTECAPEFFLIAFCSYQTGKIIHFAIDETLSDGQIRMLMYIFSHFQIVGFNSNAYDLPLIALALAGYSCAAIKEASDRIINYGEPAYQLLKNVRVKWPTVNHIDLIEVAPLSASLKLYGGRLHVPRIQDSPFNPHAHLTPAQKIVARWYCVNDLAITAFVYTALREQLQLREHLSQQYGVDVRSKSDPQVAETLIGSQITRLNKERPVKPDVESGKVYKYIPAKFLKFESALLRWIFERVREAQFVVSMAGNIPLPPSVENLKFKIGENYYQMGVGGLHSCEQKITYRADAKFSIRDVDVSSYYPMIILNTELYPAHLGPNFLHVYRELVNTRLEAKARGDKAQSEGLKIAINGTFGKLSSPYSILYAPELGMQVTVTGQLALLMLIERMELSGFHVISANTDGIVTLCPAGRESEFANVVKNWETVTGFTTEETLYAAYYARDVNNYIAVKTDGTTKNKGAFANPWAHPNDSKQAILRFHKNPVNTICIEAVEAYLIRDTPLMDTIKACRDVRKFVTVRKVNGGAVKDGEYLGRAVRWYYAKGEFGEIVYALSGNRVARSVGAKPLMDLPEELPSDLDFAWYEAEAKSLLVDLGIEES